MIASKLINIGIKKLKENLISTSILDSELILSNILNKSREDLLTNLELKVTDNDILKFEKKILRRAKNEPIAYIFNKKEFWNQKFTVNKDFWLFKHQNNFNSILFFFFYGNAFLVHN